MLSFVHILNMTKLMQWLLGVFIFLVIWLSMIKNIFSSHLVEEWMQIVLGLPIILIGLFGVSQVIV